MPADAARADLGSETPRGGVRGRCRFLETLDADDWSKASLCRGWTIHDVAAHLTLSTRSSTSEFIRGMVKARGSYDRMNADQARERATRYAPPDLIAQLRDSADSSHRSFGSGPLDPLLDALVHGQDIARPLGRSRVIPPHRAVPALTYAIGSLFYGAKKRFRGVRLVSTDAEWTHGDGTLEAAGPAGAHLLVTTGRRAGLRELHGDGVRVIAERLDNRSADVVGQDVDYAAARSTHQ